MDKTNEQLDRMTKRLFGPGANIDGDFGGELRILVSGRVIGTGATFQDALRDAQTRLSGLLAVAG